jgi:hypothetical protein
MFVAASKINNRCRQSHVVAVTENKKEGGNTVTLLDGQLEGLCINTCSPID